MFGIGFTEIIIILGIALIVIGPKNLPDMAKSMGKGYVEFMRSFRDMQRSIEEDVEDIKKTVDSATNIFDDSDPDEQEDTLRKEREVHHQNEKGGKQGE